MHQFHLIGGQNCRHLGPYCPLPAAVRNCSYDAICKADVDTRSGHTCKMCVCLCIFVTYFMLKWLDVFGSKFNSQTDGLGITRRLIKSNLTQEKPLAIFFVLVIFDRYPNLM